VIPGLPTGIVFVVIGVVVVVAFFDAEPSLPRLAQSGPQVGRLGPSIRLTATQPYALVQHFRSLPQNVHHFS